MIGAITILNFEIIMTISFEHLVSVAERHLEIDGRRRLEICLKKLSEDQIWSRPNESTTSVGIILQHLAGNIRQYIISGLGGGADVRNREAEFTQQTRVPKDVLKTALFRTIGEAVRTLRSLREHDLKETYEIQGFQYTPLEAVVHVIEHFSYHVGQIAYITKLFTDEQTGFYQGVDLNRKNL